MGLPRLDENEETVFVGFRLLESLEASMDELAATQSMSRSLLIREALTEYITARQQGVAA